MKIAIRYYSKTGNTQKLAQKISTLTQIPALDITHQLTEDVDLLFFGSGVYGNALDPKVINYLSNITVNIKEIINFSTSGIMQSNYTLIRDVLETTPHKLSEDEFHCPGTFVDFNKDRPNEDDINNLEEFTRKILASKKF